MKQKSKLQTRQQQEQTTEQLHTAHKTEGREFQSADEVVRFDAKHTAIPDSVKARLADSVAREPKPPQPKSWWRRLLS